MRVSHKLRGMTCANCRAAAAHGNDQEIAAMLHAATVELCGCEAYRLAPNSPGPVTDGEMLDLILSDPQSIQNGKCPHPGVLVQVDTFGLSVMRSGATEEQFENTIIALRERAKASGKERFFDGVCSFKTVEVRCDADKQRLFCVYDTALPAKPHHADIFGQDLTAMAGGTMSKSERERQNRARIKKFLDEVKMTITPAISFRNGPFRKYSRLAAAQ